MPPIIRHRLNLTALAPRAAARPAGYSCCGPLAQVGYEPALLFIDSKKYIFGTDFASTDWGSFDPLGYTLLVLRPVLMFADLAFVALAAARGWGWRWRSRCTR
jgi:hypothetical protein